MSSHSDILGGIPPLPAGGEIQTENRSFIPEMAEVGTILVVNVGTMGSPTRGF